MAIINEMRLDFSAQSENEAFARMVISAFIMPLNPTLEQLGDVKTAVSEAVTNAVVHGYREARGLVRMRASLDEAGELSVEIADKGCGIPDVALAMTPLYTTDKNGERSGMGFAIMQSFCDKLRVRSIVGRGTVVFMEKYLKR